MKKLILSAFFAGGLIIFTQAQNQNSPQRDQLVAFADQKSRVETTVGIPASNPYAISRQPEFPAGLEGLNAFLAARLKYPEPARQQGIEGTVTVQATVGRDGSLSDLLVVSPANPLLDAAAIEVVKVLPNWKPALEKGMPVDAQVKVPVRFSLR